jgi:aspartyl/glutamyl-tRNA(Asn/Gln) amidotransferase C subunit
VEAHTPEACVSRLAQFARLEFSPEETRQYTDEFRDIVAYVDHIEHARVSGIVDKRATHVQTIEHLRDDVVIPSDLADDLLKQVPDQKRRDDRGVKVPPVFDTLSPSSL